MQWYGFFIFIGILLVYSINILYLRYKNIFIDINELIIYVYLGAFLGGKLAYIFLDCGDLLYFDLTLNILYGGFSLLGASFFGLISLLYYVKNNKLSYNLTAFMPVSLLFLHSFGRVGCYFADCCGGIFYTLNLHFVAIFFYFITAFFGLYLYSLPYISSLYNGLFYYVSIIFLERFIFDVYRYDSIIINNFFSKYQLFAFCYLFFSSIFIFIFYKKVK